MLLGVGCNSDKGTATVSGDVTETGNAFIRGKLVNSAGVAMDSTEVALITSTFRPLSDKPMPGYYYDITDDQGLYVFTKVDTGDYHIQGVSQKNGERILIKGIRVAAAETVQVATDTLLQPGIIDLLIEYSLRWKLVDGSVYLKGTPITKAVDYSIKQDGHIIIGPVSAGLVEAVCFSGGSLTNIILADSVQVYPGQVSKIYVKDRGHNWPHDN